MNTNNILYGVLLALILAIILPMLLSRTGLNSSDLTRLLFGNLRKKDSNSLINSDTKNVKKEPHLSNGTKGELMEFLAVLLKYVKKNKISLVYPGTLEHNKNTANLLAIIITKSKIIGVNCFGFGGIVAKKTNEKYSDWYQHINGQDNKIPDPIKLGQKQYDIIRSYMDDNNMKEIPLVLASVFTNRHVNMVDYSSIGVYTQKSFISYLDSFIMEDRGIDTDSVARRINENIIRIKPNKK